MQMIALNCPYKPRFPGSLEATASLPTPHVALVGGTVTARAQSRFPVRGIEADLESEASGSGLTGQPPSPSSLEQGHVRRLGFLSFT